MPRVTRKEADQHKQDVINAAARLFRERGLAGVSVPGIMAEAGLTHGAFYGQFESKEALTVAAFERAFDEMHAIYDDIERRNPGKSDARAEFIKNYTSKLHRDRPGLGCVAAALSGEIANEKPGSPIRAAFVTGFGGMIDRLQRLLTRSRRQPPSRQETIAMLAMLIGAQVLAGATNGEKLSDEVLQAVRDTLSK